MWKNPKERRKYSREWKAGSDRLSDYYEDYYAWSRLASTSRSKLDGAPLCRWKKKRSILRRVAMQDVVTSHWREPAVPKGGNWADRLGERYRLRSDNKNTVVARCYACGPRYLRPEIRVRSRVRKTSGMHHTAISPGDSRRKEEVAVRWVKGCGIKKFNGEIITRSLDARARRISLPLPPFPLFLLHT